MNFNGNKCDLLQKYFEFLNIYEKLYAKEIDSRNEDCRDNSQKEKTDYINKRLHNLPILEPLSEVDSKKSQKDFDATNLYLDAMWDKKSVYPKIKTDYAFKPRMNDMFVKDFNIQTFNQDVNDSPRLKIKILQSAKSYIWTFADSIKR